MRERGIIFNYEMVRAVLEGRKTQTRRILKVQPHAGVRNSVFVKSGFEDGHGKELVCPFGAVGDRLWVRETWMPDAPRDGTWGDVEFYGCKGSPLSMIPKRFRKPEHCIHRATWDGSEMVGWTPSIHMPRWASRITLEITGVRVERLTALSDDDARNEGCPAQLPHNPEDEHQARTWFRGLWSDLYGEESWTDNPYVWVINFRRLQ